MRVKSKYKNENKNKTLKVLTLHGLRSLQGLQSAWSAFWGDPVRDVLLVYSIEHSNHEIRFSFVKHSGKTTRKLCQSFLKHYNSMRSYLNHG